MSDSTTVLKNAKALLETVGWCQGVYTQFDPGGDKVIGHCARGALARAFNDLQLMDGDSLYQAHKRLKGAISGDALSTISISEWNDSPARTKEEVLAAFDKAIASIKK